jgi:hypothetical protein
VRRLIAIALLVVTVPAAAAVAGGSGQTENAGAKAAMYESVLDEGTRKIQVLEWLCRGPGRLRGCHQMPDRLRDEISAQVDRPLRWVAERRRHAGVFWVLAPIVFGPGTAKLRFAWSEPGPFGCSGGGTERFSWDDHWVDEGGSGHGGCPGAVAASQRDGSARRRHPNELAEVGRVPPESPHPRVP